MLSGQWQRLGVPSLRNPFWGRLALTAAIAVVLLLYITFGNAGAAVNSKSIFGQTTSTLSAIVPKTISTDSNDTRLDGLVHGNPWKQEVGNRRRSPGAVPKVLYVSVKDKSDVGSAARSSIDGCKRMNPSYKIQIMGDAERNATVEKYAPSLLPVYSKYLPTERNDFWSYLVSHAYSAPITPLQMPLRTSSDICR